MISTSSHATVAGKRFSIGNRRSLKSKATKVTVIFLLFFGLLAITNFRFSRYETAGHNDQEIFIPIDYSKTTNQKSEIPVSTKSERKFEVVNEPNHEDVLQQQNQEASVSSTTTDERNIGTETDNEPSILEDLVEEQSHARDNAQNLSTSTSASSVVNDFPQREKLIDEETRFDKDNETEQVDGNTLPPQVANDHEIPSDNDDNSALTTNPESAVPEGEQIDEISIPERIEQIDTSTSSDVLQNDPSSTESTDNQAIVREDDNANETADSSAEQHTTYAHLSTPDDEENSSVTQERESIDNPQDQNRVPSHEHDLSQSPSTSNVIREEKVPDNEPSSENKRDNSETVNSAWPEPFQPIRDPNRRFTARHLENVFDVGLLRYSFVHSLLKEKMKYYNICSDPLYQELIDKGEIPIMTKVLVPYLVEEAQRTWTQFKEYNPGYYVKHTGDTSKGYGLFSDKNMKPNTIIGEYTGDLILNEHLVDGQYAWAVPEMILWNQTAREWMPVKVSLDSSRRGNLLRFVNDLGHGTWNLAPQWAPVNNKWRLYYVTTRAIAAGEELSIQYGDSYWERGSNSLSPNEEAHWHTSDRNAVQSMHAEYRKVALVKKYLKRVEIFPTNFENSQNPNLDESIGEGTTALQGDSVQDAVVEHVEKQPHTNTGHEPLNEYSNHDSISDAVHPHVEEQVPIESTVQVNFEDQNAPLHSKEQDALTKYLDSANPSVQEEHFVPQADAANDIASDNIDTRSDLIGNTAQEQVERHPILLEPNAQDNLNQLHGSSADTLETYHGDQREIAQHTVHDITTDQPELSNNPSNEEFKEDRFETHGLMNANTLGTPEVSSQYSEFDSSTNNPGTNTATQSVEGSVETHGTMQDLIQTEISGAEQEQVDPAVISTNVHESFGLDESNKNIALQNVISDEHQQENNADVMHITRDTATGSNEDPTDNIDAAEIVANPENPNEHSGNDEDAMNQGINVDTHLPRDMTMGSSEDPTDNIDAAEIVANLENPNEHSGNDEDAINEGMETSTGTHDEIGRVVSVESENQEQQLEVDENLINADTQTPAGFRGESENMKNENAMQEENSGHEQVGEDDIKEIVNGDTDNNIGIVRGFETSEMTVNGASEEGDKERIDTGMSENKGY